MVICNVMQGVNQPHLLCCWIKNIWQEVKKGLELCLSCNLSASLCHSYSFQSSSLSTYRIMFAVDICHQSSCCLYIIFLH